MIKIQVKYFGVLKEIMNRDDEALSLVSPITGAELLRALVLSYPCLNPWVQHVLLAVNEEHAMDKMILEDGDVVALMPPLSGG